MRLSHNRGDIESILGFRSKKYTGCNMVLSFIVGGILTIIFYGILFPFYSLGKFNLINMFFHGGVYQRSIIPYFIVFFSMWTLAILFIKFQKIKLQKKALNLNILPSDSDDFVLSQTTANDIINNLYAAVDNPRRFLILNRMERALANLQNIGRISDVAETLESQAVIDEQYTESTYTIAKGFIWAIPVMGFIGTVLGLSVAIGGFGSVLSVEFSPDKLKDSLTEVTGGLAVAFETTLIALVAALFIQVILTFINNYEEDFLDSCSDYCHKNIIARLRTIGSEDDLKY
ncbi:MotA/TolQ/ExbB proton channel family protein [Lentisphaerota bacterium WC36G]|nr:MotA/TolQ/ExbB proton channel family protein [Lentisphaerae bacterium WC36]